MTFPEYWVWLAERNPALTESTRITLSIASFRRQLEKAFEAGAERSGENTSAVDWLLDKFNMR